MPHPLIKQKKVVEQKTGRKYIPNVLGKKKVILQNTIKNSHFGSSVFVFIPIAFSNGFLFTKNCTYIENSSMFVAKRKKIRFFIFF